jgi:hypothetical protein
VRPERTIGTAVFLAAFALFVWMVPGGIFWLDSGEIGAAAGSLGIGHPTGFPLVTLLGRALCLIPLGEWAFRIHLASALCGALTVWAMYRVTVGWLGASPIGHVGALAAAWIPACGLTFFRQSTVTEVYTPSAFLLVVGMGLVVQVAQHGGQPRGHTAGLLLALVMGLSLSLHAQLRWLLCLPGGLVIAAWLVRGRRWAQAAPALVMVGAGALLYLPVRAGARREPAANWGRPATAHAFVEHLSAARIRRAFKGQMMARDRKVVVRNARAFLGLCAGELGPIALICAAVGMGVLLARRRAAGVLVAYVATLDAVYAVWVNPMGIEDLQNGIPLHLAIGVSAGAGVAWLGGRMRRAGLASASAVLVCALVPAVLADLPAKRRGSDGPDQLLHAVLDQVGPRGGVLAQSDDLNAGLEWARATSERPDVIGLPVQHLWDRTFVDAVFARAGAAPPPETAPAAQVIARLVSRGPVLWEDGEDRPPVGYELVADAPLLRVVRAGTGTKVALAALLGRLGRACSNVDGDLIGLRVCSSLAVGAASPLIRGPAANPAAATELLRGALAWRPNNAAALNNLGVATAILGNAAGAASLEDMALALDPDRYSAAVNAGRYHLAAGALPAAQTALERARTLRPQAPAPMALLAVVLWRRGERERARELMAAATAIDASDAEVRAARQEIEGRL